jgi:hypothetical protein
VAPSIREAKMTVARVVAFEGVTEERIEQLKGQMGGEPPEGLPVKEFLLLYDPEGKQSLAVLFFDNEDDYRKGDETLNAMPRDDTPGKRLSVARYDVALRMTV